MMKRAFTLIELLTVMAITAVLLTLIVLPIFQSFQILRTAQAFADAQDKGRLLTERIAREVGNAVSVRDAASTVIRLPAIDPATRLPKNDGTFDENVLPYTKLDLIPPATGSPESGLAPGVFRDPVTGKIDPTLTRPKGDINLNVVPGATIVRWWVGLNRPLATDPATGLYSGGAAIPYNEPYTGLLMLRNGNRDNLYVLRRAEVQPFVYRLRKDGQAGTNAWRPNLAYFHSDDKLNNTQDFDTRIIDLDDPYFFVPDGKYLPEGKTAYADRVNDPEKNNRVARWAGLEVNTQNTSIGAGNAVSRSVAIQTEISRYDMIRPIVVGSPPKLDPSVPVTARVVPLVQFRPTRVAAEPASGSAAARPGQAIEGIDRIGPDTYKTSRGLWTNAIVRYYPGGFAPGGNLEIANVDAFGGVSINRGVSDGSGLDTVAPGVSALFDLKLYEQYLARGQSYPFTAAVLNVNDPTLHALFTPFRVLTATGTIRTSFSIEEVGNKPTASGGPNLPFAQTTNTLTPTQAGPVPDPAFPDDRTKDIYGDKTILSAPLSMEGINRTDYDVNRAYNRVFLQYPELQTDLQRFIDLRFVPNEDGTMSPLCPTAGGIKGFVLPSNGNTSTVNRVRIVPGSDEVYAPDQSPGPNYRNIVRYTRVTGNPGPNQYRLVYADLPEPTDDSGKVDYGVLGLSAPLMSSGGTAFDPKVYDPANVVSAVIQPRFKAGYLQFDSDPSVPMPAGPITVKYRFQFNGPQDTFAVDLDTREVMQILLTIKNYPQASAPNAQTVTLKSTATLRNALR